VLNEIQVLQGVILTSENPNIEIFKKIGDNMKIKVKKNIVIKKAHTRGLF
jgi:hypothetical protein